MYAIRSYYDAIAEYFDVPFSSVLTASGSSAIIDMLGAAFLEDKDEVLFCMPVITSYSIHYTKLYDLQEDCQVL